jgi:monoamine oxidase
VGSGGAYTTFRPGVQTRLAVAWAERRDGRITSEVRSGAVWFAGEHLSDAFYGFMNGAAETGRLAARSLAADLPPLP